MHTEYALARYHDGTGEKAVGWHIQTSALSSDYQTAHYHLKCAQAGVLSKQRLGACLDQKELKIMSRWVTDWNAEGRPVVVAGPGYIRKEDLPNPDLQASAGAEAARQVQESARDCPHCQDQTRNAQQDPGLPVRTYELCPHCKTPVRYVTTRRGKRVVVCDRCGPLNLVGGERIPVCGHRSNDGLLLFLGGVALMALLGCAVCTVMTVRAMDEARSGELTREARTE